MSFGFLLFFRRTRFLGGTFIGLLSTRLPLLINKGGAANEFVESSMVSLSWKACLCLYPPTLVLWSQDREMWPQSCFSYRHRTAIEVDGIISAWPQYVFNE